MASSTNTNTIPFTLAPAEVSDAHAIATLLSRSWTSQFSRLQFGDVDPPTLAANMAPQIASQIDHSTNTLYTVMRSEAHGIGAVAQWTVPSLAGESLENETADEKREREKRKDEQYFNELPDGCNKPLVYEFMISLRKVRDETLQSRPHFLLENIATDPAHRGQGLATRLIEWVFPHADSLQDGRGVVVYLDTANDNPALKLYKRLGFEEKGKAVVEGLERFGGTGDHIHVALTREPKKSDIRSE
ncbi:acyl-CoA N-acyltransferase [Periconia macrospinosa]|uniref:Acyl-CoA N-acyltransferase n=1 Tax=Periconia macrospinosa TaxID=97972 RepID=A0A2V1E3B7_9PLEO|nr:acyl-CoA N-acyltransferase [Periconia macrospinosa]